MNKVAIFTKLIEVLVILPEVWIITTLVAGHFIEDAEVFHVIFRIELLLDRSNQFSLLFSHIIPIINICSWKVLLFNHQIVRLSMCIMSPQEHILFSNLSGSLPIWLIVELILIEVLNKGALVFLPGEFCGEFRNSLSLNVFQDVNVFSEKIDRLFIPFVLKFALSPAATASTDAAITVCIHNLCKQVLVVRIIEVTLLNHGIEEMVPSFLMSLR